MSFSSKTGGGDVTFCGRAALSCIWPLSRAPPRAVASPRCASPTAGLTDWLRHGPCVIDKRVYAFVREIKGCARQLRGSGQTTSRWGVGLERRVGGVEGIGVPGRTRNRNMKLIFCTCGERAAVAYCSGRPQGGMSLCFIAAQRYQAHKRALVALRR